MLRRNSFNIKLLSVIIPAYKQEKTIVKDLQTMMESLDTIGCKYEIIVVVDGMVDDTLKKVKEMNSSKVRLLGYERNQGKGHAVRFGMMHAKGDVIGFIDAGMDIHPAGFTMLLNHMEWYDADIIVGSKLHPASKVNYPLWRKTLSWGYRLLTRFMFGFKVRDTQVGIKFFKRKVVSDVLPRLLVKTYAFDIEFLAVAYSLGYQRIYEAPIEINFTRGSITKMNLWRVVFGMLWDTFAVFYRLKILKYYSNKNFSKQALNAENANYSLTK